MSKIVPLADELRAAIKLLHKRKFIRAANRLERLSQHILNPSPKAKTHKPVTVKLVGSSGRTTNYKIPDELLDQQT